MNRLHLLLSVTMLLIAVAISGCAAKDEQTKAEKGYFDLQTGSHHGMAEEVMKGKFAPDGKYLASTEYRSDIGGEKQREPAKADPIKRQIIFSADVRLVVKEFAKAEAELLQLVESNKGYTANADVTGTVGGSRQGTWKVRVPVERFGEFREAVKKLGELVRYIADSKDVTDEYVDLQIRIKNKEDEVKNYRRIYEAAQQPDDMLKVTKELDRAVDDLDRLKGRQRLLENLIEYTTITVHMQERNTYLPPEAPTFGGNIGQTFFGSIDALVGFGKAVVLILVALTPWLPIIAIPVALVWFIVRRRRPALAVASAETPSGGNVSS